MLPWASTWTPARVDSRLPSDSEALEHQGRGQLVQRLAQGVGLAGEGLDLRVAQVGVEHRGTVDVADQVSRRECIGTGD